MLAFIIISKATLSILSESAAQNSTGRTSLSNNNFTDNVVSFQHKIFVHHSAAQPTFFKIIYILSPKERSGCLINENEMINCTYIQFMRINVHHTLV